MNLDTYTSVADQIGGATNDPIGALGSEFGVPNCMTNLTKAALGALFGPGLVAMQSAFIKARAQAENELRALYYAFLAKLGLYEDEDGNVGLFGELSFLTNAFAVLGAIQGFANVLNEVVDDIEGIIDCINQFKRLQDLRKGDFNEPGLENVNAVNPEFLASFEIQREYLTEKILEYDRLISDIEEILQERRVDPSLEPCIPDSAEFDAIISALPDPSMIKRCPVVDPGLSGLDQEIFRLTYGPPLSKKGQYLLTSDGLYYDSQTGGLDPVYLAISGIVAAGDHWKYEYDPNLGGKGDAVSVDSLNLFKNNIFDIERVDDSQALQEYYDEDHFLATLKQQRDKHLYDLSAELYEYLDSGYTEDSSLVRNQRNVIASEMANHNNKIDRRKKQIEVCIKVPTVYGAGEILFSPGEVPINDFSFLQKYNLSVDLEKQKALVFSQAEVNGIVLPIEPKYVKAAYRAPSIGLNHLVVPQVGKGSIIYSPSGDQGAPILSLTDQITTDSLFAIYNFLDSRVSLPSSIEFNTTNCATDNVYNNAQLIGSNPNNVFFSGVSIPYLEGIVKNKSTFTQGASALGSVVRLPDTQEFRDLTYNQNGFTMECWVHVPNIMDADTGWLSGTTSSLTKVLLGSENTGTDPGVSAVNYLGETPDLDFLENNRGTSFVKGMICGFTRDRRITQDGVGYSNNNVDNDPASSLSFFIAPTISRDSSSLSWINSDECSNSESFYKMKVDLSSNSLIGNVSSQFVLLDITVNPNKNEIKFYADGTLLATSSISNVFGVDPGVSPGLPNFKKENSFEYTTSTVDGPETVKGGPKLNPFYTPWIVGGGYTDGMYQYGNFMGGDRGGIVSGLRGHIGSLKFYSKPLDIEEIETNFNAQKGYFKSINL